MSRIQAQFANLESSLKSENDRIKEEEKRAKGLEYRECNDQFTSKADHVELDTAAFGGDDAARRSREEKDKLSARNKALEADNNSLRAKLANVGSNLPLVASLIHFHRLASVLPAKLPAHDDVPPHSAPTPAI